MHRASWRQEIDAAEHLATRTQPLASPRPTSCYACGNPASLWIRSASQRFSAPRCTTCGDAVVAMFASRGIKDVTVDAIRQPTKDTICEGCDQSRPSTRARVAFRRHDLTPLEYVVWYCDDCAEIVNAGEHGAYSRVESEAVHT